MKRAKILWLGFIIGALLGVVFCLVSYFVEGGTALPKNVETVIAYLVSIPAFISIKLSLPDILMFILIIIYWALISWVFCLVWTMQLRFRYVVVIVLVVLLGALHRYCTSMLYQELEPIFTLLEGLFKGTYKIVK